jgi:hypothetical protein
MPIQVEVGLLDGESAEVIADGIAEGLKVIIGVQAAN